MTMKSGRIVRQFRSRKGSDVVIRYADWQDLDQLLAFANDLSREDTYVMLSGETVSREDEIRYLSDQLQGVERGDRIHLVATVGGQLAANSGIYRQRMRKRHVGELHISIAEQFREEGIGTELLEALKAEARTIGIQLLTLTCFASNSRALHVYEKVGFRKAGTVPGAYVRQGQYDGEVVMYLPLMTTESNS